MAESMLALGDFRFSVDTATYDNLRRTTTYRWARQDRVGQVAAAQWVGPGEDKIALQGVVYPHYVESLEQIEAMRTEASKGNPLRLVDGQGMNHGFWTIDRIQETESHFLAGGAPRKQAFRLQLTYYGESAP